MVNEPMFIAANLYTPETMQPHTLLRVINNDTGEEVPQTVLSLAPQVYQPNKNGYLFFADSKCITARTASKWKLRLLSETISPSLIDKEFITTKMNYADMDDVFHPNKHNLLFRFLLKVKDAPTAFTAFQAQYLPNVVISLTLFDNDVEICSVKGKGTATLRNALLYLVEEQVSKKDDKKGGASNQVNEINLAT